MTDPITFVLDWDDIAFWEALRRIKIIMQHMTIEQIVLYESSTQKGYHLQITTFYHIATALQFRLRQQWKDDGNRLIDDILNQKSIFRDISFSYKVIKGIKVHRTKMFKYVREKYLSDKWQVTNLRTKDSQICTVKH